MKGFVFGLVSGGIVAALGLVGVLEYAPTVQPEGVRAAVSVAPDEVGEAAVGTAEDAMSDGAGAKDAAEDAVTQEADTGDTGETETAEPGAPDDAAEAPAAPRQDTTSTLEPGDSAAPAADGEAQAPAQDSPEDTGAAGPGPTVSAPDAPESQPAPDAPDAPAAPAAPEVPDAQADAAPETGETGAETETETPPRASALGLGPESVAMPAPPESDPPPVLRAVPSLVPDRAAAPAARAGPPAIEANAIAFAPQGNAPLLSIVLRDSGQTLSDAALSGLPFPLTVVIDPLEDDAAETADRYAAAGLEIAVGAPVSENAAPADIEVSFGVFLSAVPGAVAVVDTDDGRLQDNRPRATQVVEILAETGHGLLTYENGLNAGLQIAAQDDVAAATVFRAFDTGDRDVAAMKRFLDQAAFQAGVAGPVIVEGVMRPETLQALTEWALGQRAGQVTLAPLSAALLDAALP